MVIADSVAPIADAAFGTSLPGLTTPDRLAGRAGLRGADLLRLLRLLRHGDRAGRRCSGSGCPENFNRPYSAVSITDFWRRWHMSLSRWFRDYLYIPLGGNRNGRRRTYRNLLIVFALTGFWHGANWTFLIWGLYHGGWLIIERVSKWDRREYGPVGCWCCAGRSPS